ncbi:MAG: hypothetical protein H6849_03495 [Alphaproteobacteria bacterium]|nr:MAG: hypothetical protein H6849_03495 [Alphaproteobacteria bacterium]
MKPILLLIFVMIALLSYVLFPDSDGYILFVYKDFEAQASIALAMSIALGVLVSLITLSYALGRLRQWLRRIRLFPSSSKTPEIIFVGNEWKHLQSCTQETLMRGISGDSAAALSLKGKLLWDNHQYAQGRECLEKAIRMQPKQALFYIPLIDRLLEVNDTQSAYMWARKLARVGNISPAYINRVTTAFYWAIAQECTDLRAQQNALEKALKTDPKHIGVVQNLVRCLKRQKNVCGVNKVLENSWKVIQNKELLLSYIDGAQDSWEILDRVQRLVSFAPNSPYSLYLNCWALLNVGSAGPAKALMQGDLFAQLSSQQQAHLHLVANIVDGAISRDQLRTESVLSLCP